jgi:hypothetical protein
MSYLWSGRGRHFPYIFTLPHARQLWQAMAEDWPLPGDDLQKNTRHEWLLHLLATISEEMRASMLMTFWRIWHAHKIWHAHNEMTHDKPCPSIEGSRRFLTSYLKSLGLYSKAKW